MTHVEHLVMVEGGFNSDFKTKYHNNLGNDLQAALDVLEREGWQVVASFYRNGRGTQVILTRTPR